MFFFRRLSMDSHAPAFWSEQYRSKLGQASHYCIPGLDPPSFATWASLSHNWSPWPVRNERHLHYSSVQRRSSRVLSMEYWSRDEKFPSTVLTPILYWILILKRPSFLIFRGWTCLRLKIFELPLMICFTKEGCELLATHLETFAISYKQPLCSQIHYVFFAESSARCPSLHSDTVRWWLGPGVINKLYITVTSTISLLILSSIYLLCYHARHHTKR